jgi:hypothetical protein
MKKDIKKELIDAFLLGFAGWYWRMKYWKKRVEAWEKGEEWRYWKAKERRKKSKSFWWEKFER